MLSSISGGMKKGVCNNQSDKKSEVNKMVEITKDDWKKYLTIITRILIKISGNYC